MHETERSSFRDPDACVFYQDAKVYRSIVKAKEPFYKALLQNEIVIALMAEGSLINTWEHESTQVSYILSHQRIDLLTYPYEWSLSQLLDAALLTLDIQKKLLNDNLCLKDATPYNVQFVDYRPVFIDFTSIEANQGRQVWRALNQFLETFYYPILLHFYGKINLKKIYLDNFNGIKVDEVRNALGLLKSYSFENLLQVGLPFLFRNSQGAKSSLTTNVDLSPAQQEINIRTQKVTIDFLLSKLNKLKHRHLATLVKDQSIWSHYTNDIHYGNSAYELKHQQVQSLIDQCQPVRVIDLGCNTGDFSIGASKVASKVLSVDLDINCIDRLYTRSKDEKLNITPIWMYLDNPSPAIGWQNQERKSFIERVTGGFQADMVLALALIHHLLVTSSVPLAYAMEFLGLLTQRYLVIEFVEYADPMFQKIIGSRDDIYQHINFKFFETTIRDLFTIAQVSTITETRKIYLLEKKSSI